jgi:hypothetical protein
MPAACPSPLKPVHLKWQLSGGAIGSLKKAFPDDPDLKQFIDRLGHMLCPYYDATKGLAKGTGVSPIACGVEGGKGFKVRFYLPGKGKRGGLRLGVLAVCSKMVVKVAFAEVRKDDPADAAFEAAFKSA